MEVYFDNSATTKMSEGAKNKMISTMDLHFGNPSSLHKIGLDAEHMVSEARARILSALGVQRATRGELVFVSGGTEANNLAIQGVVFSKHRKGNEKILTTMGEHASVEAPLSQLEKKGFKVVRVPTKNGEIDLDFLKLNAQGAILASFMHVNNETGAINPIKELSKLTKDYTDAVFHTDAVQGFLKEKSHFEYQGAYNE